MKIVCISDTHMRHNISIPDGDVLVHAGDFSIRGNSLSDLMEFSRWFNSFPHKYKILVPGNHDWCFQDDESTARELSEDTNVLINESLEIEGIKFYGTPIQPIFFDWAFNVADEGREIEFAKIPTDTEVLITHTPPFGRFDEVERPLGLNVGCKILRRVVDKIKPKVHIFGHIHEDYGIGKHNATTFVNASLVNARYKITNEPIIVNL